MILMTMFKRLSIDNAGHDFKLMEKRKNREVIHRAVPAIVFERNYKCTHCNLRVGIDFIVFNSKIELERNFMFVFYGDNFWDRISCNDKLLTCRQFIMQSACG